MPAKKKTSARFEKGTTDHDGDGKMGGSKKAATLAPHPMWMYRGEEARLFEGGEKIPAGWKDSPAK